MISWKSTLSITFICIN